MVEKKKTSSLTPTLKKQIDSFITSLESFNDQRLQKGTRARPKESYTFLRDFYQKFFIDRNKRADEVSTDTYAKVIDVAHSLIPIPTLWDVCVDGRVLIVLVMGGSAKIGSRVRVPGGILHEFVLGKDGKLKLLENSQFAGMVDKLFEKFDWVAEFFDSHVGCTARGTEEAVRGRYPEDAGLFTDVLSKRDMAQALQRYVKAKFGNEKHVLALQTSFDPHTGYMYMGLETLGAVNFALQQTKKDPKALPGFTIEVLAELVVKEKIIATQAFEKDPKIAKVFQRHAFPIDWKHKYVLSATAFWHAIDSMHKDILPVIKKKIIAVYPHLLEKEEAAQTELEERAIILLTNAYSGYLHHQKHHENEFYTNGNHNHDYPYGAHQEEGVLVSLGGDSPYEISTFGIATDMNVAHDVLFSSGLVRSNRAAQRIVDRSKTFLDPTLFSMAPVPIVVQEIIRRRVSDEEWKMIENGDWSDLPENWENMDDMVFLNYLREKGIVNGDVLLGINTLRKKMATLYNPNEPTSAHLVRHHLIAVPVIADKSRYNHIIVPFKKLGF